jgi:hypothetical protein
LIEFGVPADVADRVVSTVGAPSEDDAPEHDPVLQAFTSLADYLSATGDRSKQKQWLPSNFKN